MANTFATEVTGLGTVPETNSNGAVQGGRLRRYRASITMADQADGDTITLARVPAGMAFAYGVINASATLGSATVAIGVAGTPAKYRAAAVFTSAAPTLFGAVAAVDDAPLSDAEVVILTIGADDLPSSGTLVVDLYYSGV
jgi:hypothetical protein